MTLSPRLNTPWVTFIVLRDRSTSPATKSWGSKTILLLKSLYLTSTVFISVGFTETNTVSLFDNRCVEDVYTVTTFCVMVPVITLLSLVLKLWVLPTPRFTEYKVDGTAVLSTPT